MGFYEELTAWRSATQLWNLWSPECPALSKRKIPATLVRARDQNAATKSLCEWCAGSEADECIGA